MLPSRRERLSDLVARLGVAGLFVLLSINLLADFLRTHHVTGLFLLVSEALVVVLTIFRRRAQTIARTLQASVATIVSMVGPPLLRAGGVEPLMPDHVTAALSTAGLALVIVGKVVLGRSFGLVPANRGVVAEGPYTLMRHPIYTGYLITHIGFLAAHPTPMNVAVVLISDTALIVRALLEERVLNQDEQYRAYCARVGWHLMPGVF
jgi:protein-S-isoprenylcysteine O-methyltransferase Ste14